MPITEPKVAPAISQALLAAEEHELLLQQISSHKADVMAKNLCFTLELVLTAGDFQVDVAAVAPGCVAGPAHIFS